MKDIVITKENWDKRFDEEFGRAGPDANCDSVGRVAGCDDCRTNVLLRSEHKRFIKELVLDLDNNASA